MNISYRFSGLPISSAEEAVRKYAPEEFNSPSRSTVPSLAYWMGTEHQGTEHRIVEFCETLGLVAPAECAIEFEYKVAPPKGRGKESHTDVMLWWKTTCIGIEAKYTEPRYETVGKWLKSGSNRENRLQVLGGWCDLIGKVTGKQCAPEDLNEQTYQMVHRIASVCSRPEAQKHVVYQIFHEHDRSPSKARAYYMEQLERIKNTFQTGGSINLQLVLVPVTFSKDHKELVESGRKTCSAEVIKGLRSEKLLSCGEMKAETV